MRGERVDCGSIVGGACAGADRWHELDNTNSCPVPECRRKACRMRTKLARPRSHRVFPEATHGAFARARATHGYPSAERQPSGQVPQRRAGCAVTIETETTHGVVDRLSKPMRATGLSVPGAIAP
jgi:hypothetical protein